MILVSHDKMNVKNNFSLKRIAFVSCDVSNQWDASRH